MGVTLFLALLAGLFWADEMHQLLSGMAGQANSGGSNMITKFIVYVGGPINQLLFPVWALWLGRLFLAGQIG